MQEKKAAEFLIYPNPNTGIFKVAFEEEIIRPANIRIFDLMGRMVEQKDMTPGKKEMEFNLTGKAKGVYLVTVTSASGNISKRLIIN